MAFHGKDLSLKEWIKSASETLHTRSNLWSNRSPFRSFRWRKTNHAKPPQSTVCCPKPQHQTQAMAIFSAFSCQYLPTLCFNSIQQMLLNSQASSTHAVGIPRIPLVPSDLPHDNYLSTTAHTEQTSQQQHDLSCWKQGCVGNHFVPQLAASHWQTGAAALLL